MAQATMSEPLSKRLDEWGRKAVKGERPDELILAEMHLDAKELETNLLEACAMLDYYLTEQGHVLAWGLVSKSTRDKYRGRVDMDSITAGLGMWDRDETRPSKESET